ncbi:MAG: DUF3703 domain-containing protein [Flavobacteriaceae bacterium]|nr:DUF3703 domain-containing protein [Flavobacteriaceae bacterium]
MSTQILKKQFYKHLNTGKKLLKENNHESAFYHFESAHIVGQKHVYRHTLSHYWMFIFGINTKNRKEIIGQFFRIIASLLFTLIWVPVGNTGGANISPIKPIPIRKELINYFQK